MSACMMDPVEVDSDDVKAKRRARKAKRLARLARKAWLARKTSAYEVRRDAIRAVCGRACGIEDVLTTEEQGLLRSV